MFLIHFALLHSLLLPAVLRFRPELMPYNGQVLQHKKESDHSLCCTIMPSEANMPLGQSSSHLVVPE